MTILEYYLEKQKNPLWYKAYISTAKTGKAKLFSFINTNFRKLSSIFSQLDAFKSKNGKKRSEWDTMACGQEQDKHRVVNLRNFGLIELKHDRYYITDKGKEVIRIYESSELLNQEKWLLLFMLLLDYKTEERNFDIIRTVLNLVESLSTHGVERVIFLNLLAKASGLDKKEDFIRTDAFWLITFFTDKEFIDIYLKSSTSDKEELFNWVVSCFKDSKKKDDCLAYKYRSGGPYTESTLSEDINITLCVLVIISVQDRKSWNSYLKLLCTFYPSANYGRILDFIGENRKIYDTIYNDIVNYCFPNN